LILHALDGIISQSVKLLRITVVLGSIIYAITFVLGLWVMFQVLFLSSAPGWAITIVVVLFMGGLTILSIGISALFIGRISEQVKNGSLYLLNMRVSSRA
jgi:polyisoprenyl-phosphate glycosyltransferase